MAGARAEGAGLERQKSKQRHVTTLHAIDKIYMLLRASVGGAVWLGCFYFLYLMVLATAGRETTLNATINAVLKVGIDKWGGYAVGAIFGVSWWNERKLRRKTITDQAGYIRELETKHDPDRVSSGLASDGQTKKEDKDD